MPQNTSSVAKEAAMRNDARPIGEDGHEKSPIDERESVTRDRHSHIVNPGAEEEARRDDARGVGRGTGGEDQTMPTGDSTLNTKI